MRTWSNRKHAQSGREAGRDGVKRWKGGYENPREGRVVAVLGKGTCVGAQARGGA